LAWTAPLTWTVGQLVSAANLNTHIRDNLLFLKSSPVISEVTSPTVVTTENTPLQVLTTGAVAIPADVGAVYCEAWASSYGYEIPGGTFTWRATLDEASAGQLRMAGVNADIDQRFTSGVSDMRFPLYMRTTELLWAGTTRTVSLNIDSTGCVTRITGTAASPITLRIVRAY
jgi:hypothetical protein